MSPEFWLYPKEGDAIDTIALQNTLLAYDCVSINSAHPNEIIVTNTKEQELDSLYVVFITLSSSQIKIDLYGDAHIIECFRPILAVICAAGIDRAEDAESRLIVPIEGLTLAESLLR